MLSPGDRKLGEVGRNKVGYLFKFRLKFLRVSLDNKVDA